MGKRSLGANELDVRAIVDNGSLSSTLKVVKTGQLGESPLVRHDDSLVSGEYVLGSSESVEVAAMK